ncbi:hypothetical protein B0H10DRAFT_1944390 [Mycena sp. CBHHK59/15]|nr:hypothetical protein B0H10DRAFT_1944390 [Mycena sp. CBHHK59/15]
MKLLLFGFFFIIFCFHAGTSAPAPPKHILEPHIHVELLEVDVYVQVRDVDVDVEVRERELEAMRAVDCEVREFEVVLVGVRGMRVRAVGLQVELEVLRVKLDVLRIELLGIEIAMRVVRSALAVPNIELELAVSEIEIELVHFQIIPRRVPPRPHPNVHKRPLALALPLPHPPFHALALHALRTLPEDAREAARHVRERRVLRTRLPARDLGRAVVLRGGGRGWRVDAEVEVDDADASRDETQLKYSDALEPLDASCARPPLPANSPSSSGSYGPSAYAYACPDGGADMGDAGEYGERDRRRPQRALELAHARLRAAQHAARDPRVVAAARRDGGPGAFPSASASVSPPLSPRPGTAKLDDDGKCNPTLARSSPRTCARNASTSVERARRRRARGRGEGQRQRRGRGGEAAGEEGAGRGGRWGGDGVLEQELEEGTIELWEREGGEVEAAEEDTETRERGDEGDEDQGRQRAGTLHPRALDLDRRRGRWTTLLLQTSPLPLPFPLPLRLLRCPSPLLLLACNTRALLHIAQHTLQALAAALIDERPLLERAVEEAALHARGGEVEGDLGEERREARGAVERVQRAGYLEVVEREARKLGGPRGGRGSAGGRSGKYWAYSPRRRRRRRPTHQRPRRPLMLRSPAHHAPPGLLRHTIPFRCGGQPRPDPELPSRYSRFSMFADVERLSGYPVAHSGALRFFDALPAPNARIGAPASSYHQSS